MTALTQTHDQPVRSPERGRWISIVTPTEDEIGEWQRVDSALRENWDSPLTKILRFLVDPVWGVEGLDLQTRNDDEEEVVETNPDDHHLDKTTEIDLTATVIDLSSSDTDSARRELRHCA